MSILVDHIMEPRSLDFTDDECFLLMDCLSTKASFQDRDDTSDCQDFTFPTPFPDGECSVEDEFKTEVDSQAASVVTDAEKSPSQQPRTVKDKKLKRERALRWTEQEEVILIGVVNDCNILCGAITSWKQVTDYYHIAAKNYMRLNPGMNIPKRTTCAL